MSEKIPDLAYDLDILRRLPLTGATLYDFAVERKIKTCLQHTYVGSGISSSYLQQKIIVTSTAGTTSTFHEYFHAQQDERGRGFGRGHLDARDYFVGRMLMEAAAVAHSLAAAKEAENLGLVLRQPARQKNSFGYLQTETASDQRALRHLFNAAYARTRNAGHTEEKSLALAGQGIVRHLLNDGNLLWTDYYALRSFNAISYAGIMPGAPGNPQERKRIFRAFGHVSAGINMTPPEFLGPDSDAAVARTAEKLGMTRKNAPNTYTFVQLSR